MTEIKIKNFQSIGEAEFKIDGFTVIVGKNNIGKSAVIRAIDSALTNRVGKDFIRHGTKKTEVSIKRDNLIINWQKGNKAVYDINGESFSALNRSVPKPLTEAGFRRLEIGSEKLNPTLASQFSPLFLLDRGGPAVTEALSRMYKLDVISTADDLCQKQIRATKALLKTRNNDLDELNEKLEKFAGFDEIKEKVAEARKIDSHCSELEAQIDEITSFEERFLHLATEIKKLKSISNIDIPEISTVKTDIEDLLKISVWNEKLKSSITLIKGLRSAVEGLSGLETIGEEIQRLEEAITSLEAIEAHERDFSELIQQAKGTKKELAEVSQELERADKEMSEFNTCPLCERPF